MQKPPEGKQSLWRLFIGTFWEILFIITSRRLGLGKLWVNGTYVLNKLNGLNGNNQPKNRGLKNFCQVKNEINLYL
jgi:hypothetical protein